MVKYSIEPANKKDVSQINNIVNYYIENSGANWNWDTRSLENAEKWFDSHNDDMYPIYVAKTDDGIIIGYASLSPFRDKDGYWPVAENSIYVSKDYQGLKVGYKLMEALIKHAYSSKLEVITAWIDSENKSSIDFHIKWGFEYIGEMKNIGDKWSERRSVTILNLTVKKEDVCIQEHKQ